MVLGVLGAQRYLEEPTAVGYRTPGESGIFLVTQVDADTVIESPAVQISFAACSPAEVDEAYAKIAVAGGRCGAPPAKSGVGNIDYYIAYAADPDGNRIAIYYTG